MKLISTLAAAASLAAAIPAFAAPVTLDFEDQASFASLDYSASPYGISANSALYAFRNDGTADNPTGNFFNNNPSGNTAMYAFAPLSGQRAELTGSFADSVSFAYSAADAGSVTIRDASDNVLASTALAVNSTGSDSSSPFATWQLITLNFSGVAHSIDFGGAGNVYFDDVTVNAVPLPAALALLPFGLGALGLAGRRRKVA